ncbi:hypothetical protein [Dysgonomonas sp. ZJ709]|uniref:hypothetical protein n=1 Tax=Dysgonomonas sp. ZJ709 TaxID=2709797 RepID=UPI0013E9CEFA|nr:hypothetical protein [Dysgonomonas sp. ZJ709]
MNKNSKYIWLLSCFILICGYIKSQQIELGDIKNRTQFDSVMALVPVKNIDIDSLSQRRLNIVMEGDFSLYGVPVEEVDFKLKNEKLQSMKAYSIKGYKSLLKNIEEKLGTGLHSKGIFSWENVAGKSELRSYNKVHNLLDITDSLSIVFERTFYPDVGNLITNLYNEVPAGTNQNEYSIAIDYEYRDFKLYINGIPVHYASNNDNLINPFLVSQPVQSIQLKISDAPKSKEYFTRQSFVWVFKKDKDDNKTQIAEIAIDNTIAEKAYTFEFKAPYSFERGTIDLRKDPNIKDRLYEQYELLYQALLGKDENKVLEFLYPYERAKAISFGQNNPLNSMQRWLEIEDLMQNIYKVRLTDKSQLEVLFSDDGTVACLDLIDKKYMDYFFSVQAKDSRAKRFSFYFYQDNDGKLKVWL